MTKMWRTRVRPLVLNFILFGLGVTTCLMFIQMNNNEIDSPVIYTNPQEFHAAAQMQMQTQQEPPCDTYYSDNNVHTNKIKNDKVPFGGGLSKRSEHKNENIPIDYYKDNGVTFDGSERPLKTGMGFTHLKVNKQLLMSSNPGSGGDNNIYINDVTRNVESNLVEFDDTDDVLHAPQKSGPTVWVVTPTFYRPEQKAELTRVAQALLPVRNFIHWIIVDDLTHGSDFSFNTLENFMKRFTSLTYTLLKSFPPKSGTKIVGKPRGVGGRRAALEWLRKHHGTSSNTKGVVYFADDDNTYDSDVFRQMQNTKKVSMWPVGLVTELGVSSPIVKNGRVVGFYDGWNGLRKFPVDMAGFAINIQLFLDKPEANMPWVAGYEEDELLKSLGIKIQDIQPLANNCTEILVWHTKAVRNVWPKRPKNLKPNLAASTNLNYLLKSLPQKSLAGQGVNQSKSDTGFSFLNFFFGGGL